MNKKKAIMILSVCILLLVCTACQKQVEDAAPIDIETDSEVEIVQEDSEDSIEETESEEEMEEEMEEELTEDNLIESDINEEESRTVYNRALEDGETFLDGYNNLIMIEEVQRSALIYLDEDDIPELLVLKNGEYRLYACDGTQITEIAMPDNGIKANAYGPRHILENYSRDCTFYWFEYFPYQGLLRVHNSVDEERCDYYLRYEDGSFVLELEARFADTIWHTYDAKQEIDNEDFLSRLSDVGYDGLMPCGYLYENIEDAYENIGRTSNTREVLEDFISGKIDAVYTVEEVNDIPEESFVMISYEELYNSYIMGDGIGSINYVDFDNDGEEELVMEDYMGNSIFFDVIGDTVYCVIRASGTADIAYIVEMEGKRVIARTDLTHGGRRCYDIFQYDACGCVVDFFGLYAYYEGSSYTVEDEFWYREQEITMEEFEEKVNSIQRIPSE